MRDLDGQLVRWPILATRPAVDPADVVAQVNFDRVGDTRAVVDGERLALQRHSNPSLLPLVVGWTGVSPVASAAPGPAPRWNVHCGIFCQQECGGYPQCFRKRRR